jgi:hypothetical protein
VSRRPRIPSTPRRRRSSFVAITVDDNPVRAVVDAVRLAGCRCDDVDFDYVERVGPLARVVVFHQRGCPLCPVDDEAAA